MSTKTNAMRLLDTRHIPYEAVYYTLPDEEFSGEVVAALTGIPPERSFKTLCARGERRGILVFVLPVDSELDLKAAAAAAGDKRVELVHAKELFALTGYVRGGVSPIGMKKRYPTFFDDSALCFDTIAVSAGAKGCSLVVSPGAVAEFIGAEFAPLARRG